MRLFHTSNVEIQTPDIHFGRRNADFGWGFYLTPDRDFTYLWADRDSVVNEYELDTSGLDVCTLSRDERWFDYIFRNRRGNDLITADIIIGPIANDTIFDTMGIISSGFLKPADALKLLSVGPEYIQLAVKTQRAADKLAFIGSQRISRTEERELKLLQDKYYDEFSKAMEGLS